MTEVDFESLVAEAVESLPENIRKKMDNVEIVVEQGSANGPFLGLYQGVPKTAWGRSFGMMLPDKITIFKNPITAACQTIEQLEIQVRHTVWHEVAHYYGLGHGRIRELENG